MYYINNNAVTVSIVEMRYFLKEYKYIILGKRNQFHRYFESPNIFGDSLDIFYELTDNIPQLICNCGIFDRILENVFVFLTEDDAKVKTGVIEI